jgi:hypothetical protein
VSWDGESWKRAAHSYHAARRGTGAVLSVETEPARLRRMRRLMADNISLDTTYRKLTDPRDRPTPRFTAIVMGVVGHIMITFRSISFLMYRSICTLAAASQRASRSMFAGSFRAARPRSRTVSRRAPGNAIERLPQRR